MDFLDDLIKELKVIIFTLLFILFFILPIISTLLFGYKVGLFILFIQIYFFIICGFVSSNVKDFIAIIILLIFLNILFTIGFSKTIYTEKNGSIYKITKLNDLIIDKEKIKIVKNKK